MALTRKSNRLRRRLNLRKETFAVAAVVAVLLLSIPLRSQVNTGRISGAITDQTGGAIAGATVTVVDIARGASRPLTADSDGLYAAPNLTPGIYTVRAEVKGFQTLERQNVQVDAGSDVRVDITLQPGEQTQTVTVTEALPIVNTTNAQTGGTLQNNLLMNVPLNGRNYRWTMAFVPGVMESPGEGATNASINGSGPYNLNWIVDGLYDIGVFTPDASVGGPSEAGDTTLLPLDAIQEVDLVINPKAEFGWNPGLTYNVALKSGSNGLHGSAYAFGRDQDLDARNAFASTRGPVSFEQFGATVGGPIKKNKLFYFLGFEGERLAIDAAFTENSPTSADWTGPAGSCPTGVAGNCSSSIPDAIAAMNSLHQPLSTLSLNIAGCNAASAAIHSTSGAMVATACAANQLGSPSLFNNFSSNSTSVANSFPDRGGSNNGLWKLDYHVNDKHQLSGSYYIGNYAEYAVSAAASGGSTITQPYWEELLGSRSQMARAVEIWTPNSAWLNEARVGVSHNSRPVASAECAANFDTSNPLGIGATPGANGGPNYATEYGLVSGAPACGMPTVTINGFADQLGFGNNRQDLEQDIQGADNLSYTRGKHQFKFGVDVRAQSFMGTKSLDAQRGIIAFGATGAAAFSGATPLESFIAGVPSSENIQPGNPVRNVNWYLIALFAQDDWRVTPKLTLNLGLRWEAETPVRDANGLLGNFDQTTPTGMVQTNQVWKFQSDFSPHVGLSWDVTGRGRTVVRAGGGVAYNQPSLIEYIGTPVTGSDFSSEPTGALLYAANGSTIQGPGTITNVYLSRTPITSSTTNTATGNFIPWAANVPLFSNIAAACGNGLAPVGGGPGAPAVNPSPCNGDGGSANYHFIQNFSWNLNIQHAFTNNMSLDVGYVGAHSTSVGGLFDLNEPIPGAAGASAEQSRRPFETQFPWFSKILFYENFGSTYYNGLQMNLTQRVSHGLTFTANYTLSHALGIQQNMEGGQAVLNSLNPKADFGAMNLDVRNHFTIVVGYTVPGHKAPAQLLQGWAFNTTVNLLSALPYNAIDSSFDTSGTGGKIDRWSLSGPATPFNKIFGGAGVMPCYGISTSKLVTASSSPCIVVAAGPAGTPWANFPAACIAGATRESSGPTSAGGATQINLPLNQLAAIGCYSVNGSAIVPPAQGTYGTMTFNQLRGKGAGLWNASVTKDWKFKERLTAQFRVEAYNLLNRTQYAALGLNLGAPSTFGESQSTPDVSFHNPVVGSGGARAIQLGLKFLF